MVVHWAVTPFGTCAVKQGDSELNNNLELHELVHSEHVTEVELTGLDKEGTDVVVENILRGGFLDKPGVKGRGEAVLFMLVNEVINSLAAFCDGDDADEGD